MSSFAPSRGLRQGDPLSPFLFLFVADGLSLLLEEKVTNGDISPVHICRQAPGISHLLFADDTLLFFKANNQRAEVVKQVLEDYAQSTGQLINPAKCSVMFGPSSSAQICDSIRDILQIAQNNFDDKYLGFPTPEGRMRKGKFQSLQQRIWKRLIQWGESLLSSGGKEVLIKAVVQAIPVYVMGLFKLPESVCEDLNRLTRNFWWGDDSGKRKTHWKSWECLTKPKSCGGLGFRDVKLFNQALLARQAWRLITIPESLCARVLKAKYYPNGSLIDTSFGGNASPGWRAIEFGLELLKKGIIWRVGNGKSIRLWRDPWLPRDFSRRPITRKGNCRFKWVSDLITDNGTWNIECINRIFWPIDAEVICNIRIPSRVEEDCVAWHPDKHGLFSVRSAYKLGWCLAQENNSSSSNPVGMQKSWDPHKVKIFAWKAASNCLATMKNKFKRKLEASAICSICGREEEDIVHALCWCPQAGYLWSAMKESGCISVVLDRTNRGPTWVFDLLETLPETQRAICLMILWRNWYVRNEITHGKPAPPMEVSEISTKLYSFTVGNTTTPFAEPRKGEACRQLLCCSR